MLRIVRETDRGIVVRGAKTLSTLAPFANETFVGPFYPRRPGEEPYASCFALPMDTPGMKFICREAYDCGRGVFDRPLSSRFDEEDALAIFDDVEVPYERVFTNGDVETFNGILPRTPGYAQLQAIVRGIVKLRFLAGLAWAQPGELVANAEMVSGLVRAATQEVVFGATRALPHRTLAATLWVLVPQVQVRAVEVIRQLSGSGLIMTPTENDLANPEIGAYLEKYLRGKGRHGQGPPRPRTATAKDRVQLFKLAWDRSANPSAAGNISMSGSTRATPISPALLQFAGGEGIQGDGEAPLGWRVQVSGQRRFSLEDHARKIAAIFGKGGWPTTDFADS